VLWLVGRLLFALWFRFRVRGRPDPFPEGPLVVAANHVSFLDPVALGAALHRPITFLITSEVARRALFRPWVWIFDCIVVEANLKNVEALREALKVLRGGGVVGIFPEGAISDSGRIGEGQLGVASLLLQGGAPVLCAGIVGTREALPRGGGFPKRGALEVRFGALVSPPERVGTQPAREARRALRDQVMAGIAAELPARMGGSAGE
jgi:1-acyl-sn-glycerol-3-phosphate acyltransferase